MKRQRLAIVGFGRLGQACAEEIRDTSDLEIAGVVRRPENTHPLPEPFAKLPVVSHISELKNTEAALLCVPSEAALDVAGELLQARIPLVECAAVPEGDLAAHRDELNRIALNHRVAAIVGAGWDPGALTLIRRLFDVLIPRGHTESTNRPGVSLHHTSAALDIEGVEGALCTELRGASGKTVRYVYVELAENANVAHVVEAIVNDPLFVGEETLVFPVESVAALEEQGHGILVQRHGTSGGSAHQTLLLEARFDPARFAARIMLDGARRLPGARPGAYVYGV
jgi:diaminopimelate dehydrogenase